jgi:hypothetical protein
MAMRRNVGRKSLKSTRQIAIAIAASAIVAATAVHANPSNNIVLVPPTDLPELARQSGDAMLLHETFDGRTFLYIEQNRGARLAIFDVTDPVHIKGEGSVQLDAGPITHLGNDGFTVTSQVPQMPSVRDYQMVETTNTQELSRVFDMKQVREEVTNAGTGTTFLLTENGLFLIRRLAVEWDKRRRDREWFWEHTGG